MLLLFFRNDRSREFESRLHLLAAQVSSELQLNAQWIEKMADFLRFVDDLSYRTLHGQEESRSTQG